MNNDKDLEILKKNMVTLFTIFKDKPNLLVKYILEYDIIAPDVQKFIVDNKELKVMREKMENDENDKLETPYFRNIPEMKKYYDNIFQTNPDFDSINYPNDNEPKQETLLKDMKEAILSENYEKCTKIRDYCLKNDIVLKID